MGLLGAITGLLGGGGGNTGIGNSASSTQSTNDESQLDQSGSYTNNLNVKGSNNTTTLSDQGAIKQALEYATNVAARSETMFNGALATVKDQNKLLANAYQQGGAGDQTQLKYAGFILVGLAVTAVTFFATKAAK